LSSEQQSGSKPPHSKRWRACDARGRSRSVWSAQARLRFVPARYLSAAQPQPNDRGEINAFVPGLALRRAALKRATSTPNGGRDAKD